jgi:hypothetical protein
MYCEAPRIVFDNMSLFFKGRLTKISRDFVELDDPILELQAFDDDDDRFFPVLVLILDQLDVLVQPAAEYLAEITSMRIDTEGMLERHPEILTNARVRSLFDWLEKALDEVENDLIEYERFAVKGRQCVARLERQMFITHGRRVGYASRGLINGPYTPDAVKRRNIVTWANPVVQVNEE